MNKTLHKLLAFTLITSLFLANSLSAFASFSDVNSLHKNYDAIIYLEENGVINGYSNGTFQPSKSVNRAEFLKIIIEGSDIATDAATKTPFKDIQENVWYTPYVEKAFQEGWINGYNDGTFKPDQVINKVEALKILGKIQNWQLPTSITTLPYKDTELSGWYSGYLKYAADHDYLEETGNFFNPDANITRGGISEIIYRTLTYSVENQSEEEQTPDPTDNEVSENYTYFDNISLNKTVPTTFYQNEIYLIEGAITTGNYDEITAIIENLQNNTQDVFKAPVTEDEFSIPVTFDATGTYRIGLIRGSGGDSKGLQVSVTNSPATSNETALPQSPKNLSLKFKDGVTTANFEADSNTFKRLVFTQGTKEKIFVSRQNITSIPLNFADFQSFEEGAMSLRLETAKISSVSPLTISANSSKSSTLSFTASEHTFDLIYDADITTTAPDSLSTVSKISFSGTAKTDIQTKAYIIKPNGLATTAQLTTTSETGEYFGTPIIKSGGKFTFNYTAETAGRYIIAIDNKGGEPIFNHPIYVGNSIPLIPDFFDLNERKFFSGAFNLATARTELLELINESRTAHGLAEIAIDTDLNELAQDHAADMAENDYFAHLNLQNKTPNDRRLEAGIATAVGENIARDTSIEFGHYSLMRSPSHRINILKTDWERIGLGLVVDGGYVYIVEEFSTNEVTEADLNDFKNELFVEINDLREANSLASLEYNIALENATEYLNDNIKNDPDNFTQELFEEALDQNNITGNSGVTAVTAGTWSESLSSILTEEDSILEALWELIGISVDTDDEGLIHTIIILNR